MGMDNKFTFVWRWCPLMYPFGKGIRARSWGLNGWLIRYPETWVFRIHFSWGPKYGWLRSWEFG